jgi:hypothetical protein
MLIPVLPKYQHPKMEELLNHRQLKLWEQVCKQYKVKPRMVEEVKRKIIAGQFHQYVDDKKSR